MDIRIPVDGEKIAQARRALGKSWTQEAVVAEASKTGLIISRAWLANLEAGRGKRIKLTELKAICHVLKQPAENFILGKQDLSSFINPAPASENVQLTPVPLNLPRHIPLHGPICAGGTNFSFDDMPEGMLPFLMTVPAGKRIEAWQVRGDCMDDGSADAIRDGDIVLVIEQSEPQSGKIVVAMLDGELTLKKIIHHDGVITLKPKNPKHKPIVVTSENFRVFGVVLWSLRKH